MAILQKRTSSKKLPKAGQRALLNSVIQPAAVTPTPKPKTPLAIKPSITTKITSPSTIPSLTSKTTSPSTITTPATNTPVANKPVLSSTKTSGTTITMPANTAIKPTFPKGQSSASGITSKIINAGANAALGAGTGMLINKIFGKPVKKPPAGAAKPPAVVTDELAEPDVDPRPYRYSVAEAAQNVLDANENPYDAGGKLKEGWARNDEGDAYRPLLVKTPQGTAVQTAPIVGDDTSGTTTNLASRDPQNDQGLWEDEAGNLWTMNDDGKYILASNEAGQQDNEYTWTDPETGEVWTTSNGETWTTGGGEKWTSESDNVDSSYAEDSSSPSVVAYNDYPDYDYPDYDYEYAKRGGLVTMMKHGGLPHLENGGSINDWQGWQNNGDGTFTRTEDDGSGLTVDSEGNPVSVTDTEGNVVGGLDVQGQFHNYSTALERPITSPTVVKPANVGAPPVGPSPPVDEGMLNTIKNALSTPAGAGAAGALLASILGSNTSFGGQNEGLDMSKVGVINPRTTDFGIGPARYVGYEDYGVAPDQAYVPNEELLRNLNAPGYNPVNEGDYGYAEDAEAVKPMATGGLSAMAPSQTHYTFGTPVDPYATLGLRPAPVAEAVDQPLPQKPPTAMPMGLQQPPQGASMPPRLGAMRQGGLPMVEGRLDYRSGASVHGAGDGQSDDIPAMLADGEYVLDAETVAQIGNGSTKAGAKALDKFRENIRAHKRGAPVDKIPPKTKVLTSYLKGAP